MKKTNNGFKKLGNTGHKTKNIVVKSAPVDKAIIPVVEWLNSFQNIYTQYSCEGSDREEHDVPYVSFRCYNERDLTSVIIKLSDYFGYGNLDQFAPLSIDHWSGGLRYYLCFKSKKYLSEFCEYLKTGLPRYMVAYEG